MNISQLSKTENPLLRASLFRKKRPSEEKNYERHKKEVFV